MAVIVVEGPPGPSAGASDSYEYDSVDEGSGTVASHVINHNLGFKPNVSAFILSTGQQIAGRVIHHSNMQLEIVFNTPQAIIARLS